MIITINRNFILAALLMLTTQIAYGCDQANDTTWGYGWKTYSSFDHCAYNNNAQSNTGCSGYAKCNGLSYTCTYVLEPGAVPLIDKIISDGQTTTNAFTQVATLLSGLASLSTTTSSTTNTNAYVNVRKYMAYQTDPSLYKNTQNGASSPLRNNQYLSNSDNQLSLFLTNIEKCITSPTPGNGAANGNGAVINTNCLNNNFPMLNAQLTNNNITAAAIWNVVDSLQLISNDINSENGTTNTTTTSTYVSNALRNVTSDANTRNVLTELSSEFNNAAVITLDSGVKYYATAAWKYFPTLGFEVGVCLL